MSLVCWVFIVALLVGGTGCYRSVSFDPGALRILKNSGKESEWRSLRPVSVAPLDSHRVLVANYKSVRLYDLAAETNDELIIDGLSQVPRWNPTGLAFWSQRGELFIANYEGNDLVVVQRGTDDRWKVQQRLTHPSLISPENVALSADGNLVAAACYDGNAVVVFERHGAEWVHRWTAPVALAHGVTFTDFGVVATSLGDRKLVLLAETDGKRLREVGGAGWGANEYLWPTSVYSLGDGELIVADAHTGFLTVLGVRSLKQRRRYGGNGPTHRWFNMPYAAVPSSFGVLIVSTFQDRLVVFDPRSERATAHYGLRGRAVWQEPVENSEAQARTADHWTDKYVRRQSTLRLLGKPMYLGYGLIHSIGLGRRGKYAPAGWSERLLGSDPLYFLENVSLPDGGAFVFSPSRAYGLYFRDGERWEIYLMALPVDCWSVKNRVICPEGDETNRLQIAIDSARDCWRNSNLPPLLQWRACNQLVAGVPEADFSQRALVAVRDRDLADAARLVFAGKPGGNAMLKARTKFLEIPTEPLPLDLIFLLEMLDQKNQERLQASRSGR